MKPYMSEEEAAFLTKEVKKLKANATIVEWGSGGSTLMLMDLLKPKQRLFSIEHNPEWANKVINASEGHANRDRFMYIITQLQLMEVEIKGKKQTYQLYEEHKNVMMGTFLEENPSFISNYIDPSSLHENFTDILTDSDLFLVDGLARGAVLATLKVRAKKKAKILIHDYEGRVLQYEWAMRLFDVQPKVVGTFALLTI